MGFLDLTILSMFAITALSNSAYALIAPFLPFEFEKKQIDQQIVGYIFSIYSVAVIVASPMIGKIITKFGRRFLIRMGVILMGLSFIGFGAIDYIENKGLYIGLTFLIRLLQGFASSSMQTTIYSICTNFYPEKKEALVGYLEAVTGIGLILGPIFGSILYSIGGISFTFYTFGCIFLVTSLFISAIFPDRVDSDKTPLFEEQMHSYMLMSHDDHHHLNQKPQIGYFTLLKEPRYLLAATAGALGYFLYGYMEPILAYRLAEFQLTQLQIGFFFTILPIFYIPMSILVQYTPRGLEKRAILITACFLSFFVNICVGPSQLLGFPDSIWIMAIGQALHGIVDPFILVPSLPEMIESVIDKYPDDEFLVNDLSSGIFNSFLGLGQISGPLFGSFMVQLYNFRLTGDYCAIILLTFSIIYFIFGSGWKAFRDSKFTNYGQPAHFAANMTVNTPTLNRSRLMSNFSHDIYLHGGRKYSVFSTSQINIQGLNRSHHWN